MFRIICLGGSSTWGYPLKDTRSIYPAVLEQLLNNHSSGKEFEVINAGVGGYSTFQQIRYFKKAASSLVSATWIRVAILDVK